MGFSNTKSDREILNYPEGCISHEYLMLGFKIHLGNRSVWRSSPSSAMTSGSQATMPTSGLKSSRAPSQGSGGRLRMLPMAGLPSTGLGHIIEKREAHLEGIMV